MKLWPARYKGNHLSPTSSKMVQAYCLKEKKHVEVKDPVYKRNARDTPVVAGTCSSCGGKVTKILKKEEIPPKLAAEVAEIKRKKSGKDGKGEPKKKPSGKRPSGKKPSGKKPSGKRPSGKKPSRK